MKRDFYERLMRCDQLLCDAVIQHTEVIHAYCNNYDESNTCSYLHLNFLPLYSFDKPNRSRPRGVLLSRKTASYFKQPFDVFFPSHWAWSQLMIRVLMIQMNFVCSKKLTTSLFWPLKFSFMANGRPPQTEIWTMFFATSNENLSTVKLKVVSNEAPAAHGWWRSLTFVRFWDVHAWLVSFTYLHECTCVLLKTQENKRKLANQCFRSCFLFLAIFESPWLYLFN